MRKLCLLVMLSIVCSFATAQTVNLKWGSAGAATRFGGSGLTLAYGQQDLFAPGTDARFGAGYFNAPYYATGFSAEITADALATTYDPAPDTGLALVAYGGLGPRFLVQSNVSYYAYPSADGGTFTSYQLNVGGVGGFETRLGNLGVFLELDISLPAFGLIGPYFRVFPFEAIPVPKLTLGANYYF